MRTLRGLLPSLEPDRYPCDFDDDVHQTSRPVVSDAKTTLKHRSGSLLRIYYQFYCIIEELVLFFIIADIYLMAVLMDSMIRLGASDFSACSFQNPITALTSSSVTNGP